MTTGKICGRGLQPREDVIPGIKYETSTTLTGHAPTCLCQENNNIQDKKAATHPTASPGRIHYHRKKGGMKAQGQHRANYSKKQETAPPNPGTNTTMAGRGSIFFRGQLCREYGIDTAPGSGYCCCFSNIPRTRCKSAQYLLAPMV